MAVVKTPQGSSIGIKVANGFSATGAAQFRTLRFSNVKSATVDQDLFDIGVSIAGLQSAELAGISRTDNADLASE